jgi:RNA polymerase sigma-70 factor (ECF subfamily)
MHMQAEMLAQAMDGPSPSDAIVELIAQGDHRAAVTLCARRHGGALGRVCMALLSSQADADEAVQETLLAAHRGFAGWRGEGSVRAWLFGIARHVCARRLEGRRRDQRLLEIVPTDGEAADGFAARRRARAVRRALEQLRPSERDALVLRYVAELSHREIAEACHLDEAAARKRVSRALEALRSVLPAEEIE